MFIHPRRPHVFCRLRSYTLTSRQAQRYIDLGRVPKTVTAHVR